MELLPFVFKKKEKVRFGKSFKRYSGDYTAELGIYKEFSTEELLDKLNWLGLAVWFMDDGSCCSDSDYYLNTQQYSAQDQKILLKRLKDLGLDANLNRDKEYQRIRFLKSSIPRLKELISDNIVDSYRVLLRGAR